MVTGTTASASDQIIITGNAGAPQALASSPRYSVCPGKAEAGFVEHGLGDRIGDDGARRAVMDRLDRARDRFDRRRGVGRGSGGRARLRPGSSSGTTGRPRENAAAAPAGSVSMTGVATPARLAAAARTAGAARTKNGTPPVRSRQAASASSGPIPAGSPIVIASGALSPVFTAEAASQFRRCADADVRLDVAERAQHELEHQRLVACRRVIDDGAAGIFGVDAEAD